MRKLNDYIADRMSMGLSTMTAFYLIFFLVFIPLFYTQPINLVAWASYMCSVVFQGIALPVLGYTSRKASDKSDAVNKKIMELLEEVDKLSTLIENQQEYLIKKIDEKINLVGK